MILCRTFYSSVTIVELVTTNSSPTKFSLFYSFSANIFFTYFSTSTRSVLGIALGFSLMFLNKDFTKTLSL